MNPISSSNLHSPGDSGSWVDASVQLWARWRDGQFPELEELFARGRPLNPVQVGAVLRVDQEERWRRGQRVTVETYLEKQPGLLECPGEVLNLIYREFVIRQAMDEGPQPEEYFDRFPQFADKLRKRLVADRPPDGDSATQRKLARGKLRRKTLSSLSLSEISLDDETAASLRSKPGPALPNIELRDEAARDATPAAPPVIEGDLDALFPDDVPEQLKAKPVLPSDLLTPSPADLDQLFPDDVPTSTPAPPAPSNVPKRSGPSLDQLFPDDLPDSTPSSPPSPTASAVGVPRRSGPSLDRLFPDEAPSSPSSRDGAPSGDGSNVQPSSKDSMPSTKDSMPSSKDSRSSSKDSNTTPGSSDDGHKPKPRVRALPKVENYELRGELGRGGMGVVYKAIDLRLKRIVALKMVLTGIHAGQREIVRFRGEAEAVARLHHPNIVQIYEVGEQDGCPYLALEYVGGESLARKLTGTPMGTEEAARIIEISARAIHVAHLEGVIHRDLKPANILLTERGEPKITDFGLAKRLDEDEDTRTSKVIGTPCYMAPEQAAGSGAGVTSATDTYALGSILYEMLTGRPPFKAATAIETIEMLWSTDPVPPRQLQPKLHRDIETICLKCLAKDPAKRYASSEALADDLARFLAEEPILARPITAWERGVKWAYQRPGIVAMVLMGIAVLVGVFTLTLWHNNDLKSKLEEARRAEKLATDEKHLASLGEEARQLLIDGQTAFQERRFREAELAFAGAQAKIGTRPEFAEVRNKVEGWLEKTRPQLLDQEATQAARKKLEQFGRLTQDALFHATAFGGLLDSGPKRVRTEAEQALALFEVGEEDKPPVIPEGFYTKGERADILVGCFQMFLLLAEVAGEKPGAGGPDALRCLDRAAKLGLPDTRALHLRRARYLEAGGDAPAAAAESALAAKLSPTQAFEHFIVGEELFRRGDLEGAVRACDQALYRQPGYFPAQYLVAVCYLKGHRLTEAKVTLNACLALRPEFVWLYLLRGHVHSELKEFENAAQDFRAAADRNPDPAGRYGLLLHRGTMFLRQGDLAAASTDFQEAVTLQPDLFPGYVNLARVYQKRGDLDGALRQMTFAIARGPREASLPRNRAHLYLAKGDDPAALADLRRALELEPALASSASVRAEDQVQCARLLRKANQFREAVVACDAALSLAPDSLEAYQIRGECLLDLRNFPEAVAAFDAYLKRAQGDADVYRSRGYAKANLGTLSAAILDYSRAIDLRPDSPTLVARGWALAATDQLKPALLDFEEAVKLDPKSGLARVGRGLIRAKTGQAESAVVDVEAALKLGPATPALLLTAARTSSVAAVLVDPAGKDAKPETAKLRANYQELSLTTLRQLIETRPAKERAGFWDKFVRTETDFKGIRTTPGYAQLTQEVTHPDR